MGLCQEGATRRLLRGQFLLLSCNSKVSQSIIHSVCDENIVEVTSGENHNLFVADCGTLYSSGSNIFGQLGIGDEEAKPDSVFTQVKGLEDAQALAVNCGSDHSFVMTHTGEVYSWGLNFKGQLGLGDVENRFEATLVQSLAPDNS